MDFLRDRGLEIARFLVWVIRELQIPPISQSGDEGGLALLGWSLGNITTLAFLSNLRTYPRDIVETLEPYLRTFVMYGTSQFLWHGGGDALIYTIWMVRITGL